MGWKAAGGVGRLAFVAGGYFCAARIGLWFVLPEERIAGLWPAGGVALAALLLSKRSEWPGVLATIFTVSWLLNVGIGERAAVSAGFALVNMLEPLFGAWLMQWFAPGRIAFQRLRDVLGLMLTVGPANALAALAGAAVAALAYGAPFERVWVAWLLSNGMGMLVATPLILTWAAPPVAPRQPSPRRTLEALVLLAMVVGSTWFAFGAHVWSGVLRPYPYIIFPSIIWAGVRFRPRGATAILALIAVIVLALTASGQSRFPLGGDTAGWRLLAVEDFLQVAAVTGLLVAAIYTERADAEAALRESQQVLQVALAGKETLLRELYHRTKNNMQAVIAMLEMQAADMDDERLRAALRETENRIQSMALVHHKLYQSQNLSSIDLGEYLTELARLVHVSYGLHPDLQLRIQTESAQVLIDAAAPCGLVVNEILSNALKHAFPDGRDGEISVEMRRGAEGEILIEIADNGVGLPPGLEPRRSRSMGLRTIFGVVEQQLHGRVSLESREGVRWRIEFADSLYQARV